MNTRSLTKFESDNLTALNEANIPSTLLFITATGLNKSILDATDPMREMLLSKGIHNYTDQSQGPDGKKLLRSFILTAGGPLETQVSLYRPKTKNGDPRMWFSRLTDHAKAEDVFAVFILKNTIHAINLSSVPLAREKGTQSPLGKFFASYWAGAMSVAEELLARLRAVASKGPIRAICAGSTAVGRSIEAALGININSSQLPDYNGIEIKSGRSLLTKPATRATLFACVPDWALSNLKSSAAILERYGYKRGGDFKLYCTVSARKANSQGLKLTVDAALRWLKEIAVSAPVEVAIWPMTKLERKLVEKHRETFWIRARPEFIKGKEHFQLQSVTHTRNPNLPQLERMLSDGTITLDHLIKRQSNGKTSEKGPLFKIKHDRIRELFLGEPKQYSLAS